MIWLLVGYMWLFIHRPFEVWPWLGEYRIERVYMLVTLGYWALRVPKTLNGGRIVFPVCLLAGTYLIASQTSPYATFATVEDWFKVFVFFLLLVTSVNTERELKILVVAFVGLMALYELHSLREFANGRYVWRMGTKRMVGVDATRSDPNSFGATINYAIPWLYPVWTLAVRRWQQVALVGAFVLGVACILLTGSRSSFVALIVITSTAAIVSKYRWRILPCVLAVPLVWGVLRPDLQNRYMSIIDPNKGVGGAQASAEGRMQSFLHGMRSFARHPVAGAGLGSYRAETGFQTHNLYNQAMGELGVSGLLVLLGFAWAFVSNWTESRRLGGEIDDIETVFLRRICVAALVSCLVLFLLGWGSHNLPRYNWLWFGAFSGFAVRFLRERAAMAQSSDNGQMDNAEPCM